MYAAIGVNYDYGGETFVNGISQHNNANGFRPARVPQQSEDDLEIPAHSALRTHGDDAKGCAHERDGRD